MVGRTVSVAGLLCALGCVSVTPAMQGVRVTNNPDVVRGCKFMGNVTTGAFWRTGAKDSENAFRKRVVELGGNVGYVVSTTSGRDGLGSAAYSGEAYRCEAPAR